MNDNAIETIFDAAVQLSSPAKRKAYLDLACEGDSELREKLETMLTANDRADQYLANAASHMELDTELGEPSHATDSDSPLSESPGTVIGRYKLLQKLGEGGMGVVYMAEQTEPVTRKVALKIIKLGMDTQQVVARFEAERQALAMMDHPNIAKVLDGGATEAGRLYFVMELVRGVPITEYGDKNRLSTRQRLELFIPVCQAIQHAHHKGVIHRDIKPSNVMVTLNDGVPHPMVIDFGIAKATTQKLTEKTLFTHYAQMIGTPAYMSPEQAEMSKLDVDTRTDIYSLGVLLYELMTGTTPFPSKELLSVGYGEMQKIIAEKEPPKLSTCLSTMGNEERTVVAKNRSMEASALGKMFQGDLDCIVLKALEKDRTRRYETVNGLVSDIQRHLSNEPISAAPPTFGYQFRKFVSRNRKYARVAAGIAGLLVLATFLATWQAVRATRAQRLAQAAHAAAERQRMVAQEKQNQAQSAQAQASAERNRARQNEAKAQKLLLLGDMRDAQNALEVEDLGLAAKLVERHLHLEGGQDARGWEWRHLWLKTRGDYLKKLSNEPSPIHSLSISRDGRWAAIGRSHFRGPDILSVLHLDSGEPHPHTPAVHHGRVRAAFSPGTDLLAFSSQRSEDAAGDDIQLWNPVTSETVGRFSLEGTCQGLAFTRDGKTLFAASDHDGPGSCIVRWDTAQGERLPPLPTPQLHGTLASSEVFTVDESGQLAAYVTTDNSRFEVVDLETGKPVWSTNATRQIVVCLAFSPNGDLLASAGGFGAEPPRLFNSRTGEQLATLPGHFRSVREFVFWPDGKTLLTACDDQALRLWDLEDPRDPRLIRILRGHQREVWQAALAPNGRTLVTGDRGGAILLWDTQPTRKIPSELRLRLSSNAWQFSADGESVIAVENGWLVRLDGNGFQEKTPLLKVDSPPYSSSFSQNRKFLGLGSENGYVTLCDLQKQQVVHRKKVADGLVAVVMTGNDGTLVAAAGHPEYALNTWDLSRPTPLQSVPMAFPQYPFATESMDGRWFARNHTGTGRGLLLEDRVSQMPGVPIRTAANPSVARFSPDATLLAVRSDSGVRVYDTRTKQEQDVFSVFTPKSSMLLLAFSPDGSRLVTGDSDPYGLRLWDTETGQPTISFKPTESEYTLAAFSPDGRWLGASTQDELHLWRAPTWEELKTMKEPRTD